MNQKANVMKTKKEIAMRIQELDERIEEMKSRKTLEQLRNYDKNYDWAVSERQALVLDLRYYDKWYSNVTKK